METQIRCTTHKRYPPHTVVNAARFCLRIASESEEFMHNWSTSAGGIISAAKNSLRERLNQDAGTSGVIDGCFFIFFTCSGLSHLVDAAFCVHFSVSGACPFSAASVISLRAPAPHYRTYPRLCAPPLCLPHRGQ